MSLPPGGLETCNLEVVGTIFSRVSGDRVSKALITDPPEVGWMARENPSLPGAFVFCGPALGFGVACDLGRGGGFFTPSRQLQLIQLSPRGGGYKSTKCVYNYSCPCKYDCTWN